MLFLAVMIASSTQGMFKYDERDDPVLPCLYSSTLEKLRHDLVKYRVEEYMLFSIHKRPPNVTLGNVNIMFWGEYESLLRTTPYLCCRQFTQGGIQFSFPVSCVDVSVK